MRFGGPIGKIILLFVALGVPFQGVA